MQFHIGAYVYTLVVSDRALFDEEGNQLEGSAHEGRRLLIISPIVERERREEVARHEYRHAWLFHVPSPADEEEACQLFAMISAAFERDLEAGGGREMLEQMTPKHVPHLGRPAPARATSSPLVDALGSTDRATCGCCGSDTLCGSIHHREPEADAAGRFRMLRWFTCDVCGGTQVWWQYCRSTGELLAEYVSVPAPKILRGPEAAAWLAEHQEQLAGGYVAG